MLGNTGFIFHVRGGLGPLTQPATTDAALRRDVAMLLWVSEAVSSTSSSLPLPKRGALTLARTSGVVEREISESVSS